VGGPDVVGPDNYQRSACVPGVKWQGATNPMCHCLKNINVMLSPFVLDFWNFSPSSYYYLQGQHSKVINKPLTKDSMEHHTFY
jgi:hypothetical protein